MGGDAPFVSDWTFWWNCP